MTFKKNQDTTVKTPSLEIFKALMTYAHEKTGLPTYRPIAEYDADIFGRYSNIVVENGKLLCASRATNGVTINIEEFIEYCDNYKAEQPVVIKLTKDYDAYINKEAKTVSVGCQTIPFDKILEVTAQF